MESGLVLRSEIHLNSEERDNGVASSNTVPQQPVKKPTRQWAAWTRQEEESFFTALRQVGKNFEKITRRVQSKNKDQVRHYYYRLVRRMNKLLGQGLYLDAKNSKDTNAAMLRWWSLLEKYSCKASKLHLKPRRFKIFVEALELQLLKDRKKSVRKRPQGEYSPTQGTVTNQRVPGQGNRNIKLVLVDSQSIQKVGSGKTSLKRSGNVGINRGNNKGDLNTMKPAKQRRKPAVVSSAAYRKWEKAAIAGVSLVADAAEHLERTSSDKEPEQDLNTSGTEKSSDPGEQGLHSLPTGSQNPFVENGIPSSAKIKLQLFPIDDGTRRALELDKHNPHLELTLSTRKKIASVLEHMNRKWGNSNVAVGEIILFPYGAQRENLVGCQRWTQESTASAADVFSIMGSPPVFRLRYGWFPTAELGNVTVQEQTPMASSCKPGEHNPNVERTGEAIVSSACISPPSTNYQTMDINVENLVSVNKIQTSTLTATNMCNKRRYSSTCPNDNLAESSYPAVNKSWHGKGGSDGIIKTQLGDTGDTRLGNGNGLSAGEWADSLTNISVGDLLSGVSLDMNDNCTLQPVPQNSHCLQHIAFSCDSFDAAIAAHVSRQKEKMGFQATLALDASSIWDADETCDGFSFQKKLVQTQNQSSISSLSTSIQAARPSLVDSCHFDEELSAADGPTDFAREEPMDDCVPDKQLPDNQVKDFSELADIYWPESLGPLDLDVQCSKYHSGDLILSDSLGGLNRLIASSLDAFQNCSFFGWDKKDATSTVEARETSSFSNFKIESGL